MKKQTITISAVNSVPYSKEEKHKLFVDGNIRCMANVQRNKKRYSRKGYNISKDM